jgi:hypothetical protein
MENVRKSEEQHRKNMWRREDSAEEKGRHTCRKETQCVIEKNRKRKEYTRGKYYRKTREEKGNSREASKEDKERAERKWV